MQERKARKGFKYCSKKDCQFKGIQQPIENFNKDKNFKNKLTRWCKSCFQQYRHDHKKEIKHSKQMYYREEKENPEFMQKRAQRTERAKNTPGVKYSAYKQSAKKRSIEFELTKDEFMTFWQKPCIYGCSIDTISLDRINSSKGYTIDNVVPMCCPHNQMKSNRTLKEFEELCARVTQAINKALI